MSQLEAKNFPEANTLIGKGQNEYKALPAFYPPMRSTEDNPVGLMTVCWEVTPAQLEEIKKTGCIWHSTWTFWKGYQPVSLQTDSPFEDTNAEALPEPPEAMPAVLFDGHAVYEELTEQAKRFTSPENVSAVLDAVVRLIKKEK